MAERTRYRSFIEDNTRWEGFEFRAGDIVISTPPKCGTTWTQMLCALLVFQTADLPGTLAQLSPWVEMQTNSPQDVCERLRAQEHRRFVKSHTPWDGLPIDDRVTYVCVGRDPREVALSWANHVDNANIDAMILARINAVGADDLEDFEMPTPPPEDPAERFWLWVDDERDPSERKESLHCTLHHLESFWRERSRLNVILLHYSDMRADLAAEARRLADALGIDVDDDTLAVLVDAAGFENMKAGADRYAPDVHNAIWKDNAQFFESGGFRDWQSIIGTDGARYDARVAELTDDAEFVAWVHH